jgi:hypothetical protein
VAQQDVKDTPASGVIEWVDDTALITQYLKLELLPFIYGSLDQRDTMAETPPAVDTGERLRLQGNDAFATKDWKRAVDLYQRSVNHGGANAQ